MKNRSHHKNKSSNSQVQSSAPIQLTSEFSLPDYTLIKPLGHGSQGKVFLARRKSDGKEVAVKRLNIESVKTWKSYELFHREAEVLKDLHIEGVATFYDAFDRLEDDPPCAYILQEFIPGETLASLIKAGHRFSIDRVYDVMIQMLKIIKQLHEHTPPIIHRDIKPSNIILQPLKGDNFKVHLVDFGAVSNPQLQGGGSTVAGTYGFMPPEQLMSKPVPQSDIYALAAVTVNLITGKSPADMPVKDFHRIFEPEMQFMPVAVVDVLRRMLEPDAEKRLSDYDTLIHLFEQFRLGKYDNSVSASAPSPSNYENALKQVKSYAQPGNVELWQQLPDKRDGLDDLMSSLPPQIVEDELDFGKDSNIYYSVYNENKNALDEKYRIHQKGEQPGSGDSLLVIISFILVFLWMFFIAIYFKKGSGDYIGLAVFSIFGVFIIPYLFLYLMKRFLVSRSLRHIMISDPAGNEESRGAFFSTFKEGRKTIATIVSIEYFNVKDELCEQHIQTQQFAVHQRPSFKVKYSFNPPDDSDPNDLVHEIIVHEAPETFLKVGDPFPILYSIDRMGNAEHVFSIPFPIVISDLVKISEIVGQSIRSIS